MYRSTREAEDRHSSASSEYGSAYQWPVERFKDVMDAMDARSPRASTGSILGTDAGHDEQKPDARDDVGGDGTGPRRETMPERFGSGKVIEALTKSTAYASLRRGD